MWSWDSFNTWFENLGKAIEEHAIEHKKKYALTQKEADAIQDNLIAQALKIASKITHSSADIQVRLSPKKHKNKRNKNPGDWIRETKRKMLPSDWRLPKKKRIAIFIEITQKPTEMDPISTVANNVWQLNQKNKKRSNQHRGILMVKCPKCGKENTHADKKFENQIFKISSYTCLNCATQFKSQS